MAVGVLQSIEQIRKRLGYDDIEVVNDAIESALESATIALEDSVRSEFDRASVQDIFFVPQTRKFPTGNMDRRSRLFPPFGLQGLIPAAASEVELRLSRGFVDTTIPYTVIAGNSLRNALGTGQGQNFDLRDPDDFTLLEAESGVMRIHEFILNKLYVVVNYTCGFLTDGACPPKFEDTGGNTLPGWLMEAAALKTTLILDGNPVVRREPLGDETIQSTNSARKSIQNQLDQIITGRSRYEPGAWKALQSTVTPITGP